MANLTQFNESYKLFFNYVGYYKTLSYDEWNAQPVQYKCPSLFVQFFPEICAAWNKANAYDFIPSDDGVAVTLQYLEKNVPILEQNPSRFTKSYIYKVAYNCMYCICHDLASVKNRWEHELPSNLLNSDGDEFDAIDTFASNNESAEEYYERTHFEDELWQAIEDQSLATKKVINYLLEGKNPTSLKKRSKASSLYATDPLRDVVVTLDEAEEIIIKLRSQISVICDKYGVKHE